MMFIKCYSKLLSLSNIQFHNRVKIRNVATIIDGKKISSKLQSDMSREVETLSKNGKRCPHLVLVRVGDDPASSTYVRNKMKAAEKIGMKSSVHHLPNDTSKNDILKLVDDLNADTSVDGILVQLPLPDHIPEKDVCQQISVNKDVDGFHVTNIGRFCLDVECLGPCTPLGVIELIKQYEIPTFGKNAVVCGRSKNVGMPIAMLLHGDGVRKDAFYGGLDATTTICHRYTPRELLKEHLSKADIVVTAAGIPNLVTGEMVKPGCAILDVGINRISDPKSGKTKLVGDCHFESCSQVASYITPVPGGVGPMTVAMLLRNTLEAFRRQDNL